MPAKKVAKKVSKKTVQGTKKPEAETHHIAVAIARKHGFLFFKHSHYDVNVLEVSKRISAEDIRDSAIRAAKMSKEVTGNQVHILFVEEIEIANQAFIDKTVAEMKNRIIESI